MPSGIFTCIACIGGAFVGVNVSTHSIREVYGYGQKWPEGSLHLVPSMVRVLKNVAGPNE